MKALDILARLRNSKKAPTSGEVRACLKDADDGLEAALARLDELNGQRASMLLDPSVSEGQLDDLEAQITATRRESDRLALASEELRRRLEEAEASEAAARRDALHAEGERNQRRAVELLNEYREMALEMRDVLREMAVRFEEVRRVNRALREAGDARQVVAPGCVVSKHPGGNSIGDVPKVTLPDPVMAGLQNIWPPSSTDAGADMQAARKEHLGGEKVA